LLAAGQFAAIADQGRRGWRNARSTSTLCFQMLPWNLCRRRGICGSGWNGSGTDDRGCGEWVSLL
jgi:hypothetical protein